MHDAERDGVPPTAWPAGPGADQPTDEPSGQPAPAGPGLPAAGAGGSGAAPRSHAAPGGLSRLRRRVAGWAAGVLAVVLVLAVVGVLRPVRSWWDSLDTRPADAVHAAEVARPAGDALPVDPASAQASPAGSPSPGPVTVPAAGAGTWTLAAGAGAVVGTGRLRRYQVVVEDGSDQPADAFAAAVDQTLADPRGWTAGRQWAFQRVSGGPVDFVVRLATPATVDRICGRYGVSTGGELSCRGGADVVINLRRWLLGVPWYADDLPEYRHMLINHEVGHFLGHNHERCPGPGRLAPVMQTQTIDLTGCQRNGWPYPDGHGYAGGPPAP